MSSISRVGSAAILFATLAAACSGKNPYEPGTKLGTFHVSAALKSSTCGPTVNPWEFDVRLNHEGTTLYWIQGGAPIGADVDTSARTVLKAEVVQEVRAAAAKREPCSIARSDVLALQLASADAQPAADPAQLASFAGTLIYTFAPTAGSDCADQVQSSGGDFAALPCEVHYDLTGMLTSPP